MFICSLDALKKSSKKNETGTEKEIVEVLQQASDRRENKGKQKIQMMKFLSRTLYLLARLSLTLNFSVCFH